jgi:hypothetical protein
MSARSEWSTTTKRPALIIIVFATLDNPFQSFKGMEGMEAILTDLRAGPHAPVIVCVHYACPHIEYLDRSKSRIGLE